MRGTPTEESSFFHRSIAFSHLDFRVDTDKRRCRQQGASVAAQSANRLLTAIATCEVGQASAFGAEGLSAGTLAGSAGFRGCGIEEEPGLASKLPQMMVCVQIAPAHPVFRRHLAEEGVRGAGLGQIRTEFVQGCLQRRAVLLKLRRACATLVLSDLRRGGNAWTPLHGGAECDPFEPRRGQWQWRPQFGNNAPTERDEVGVVEMAQHLVWGHFAPERRVVRRQVRKPGCDCGTHGRVIQILQARVFHAGTV